MSEWAPKRFWTAARVDEIAGGLFQVMLDDRPLRTPGRTPLALPTPGLAAIVAEEWNAQDEKVDPNVMPMTRMANSAIDRIGAKRGDVVAYIAAYGETDLLCYRADHPEALVARQKQAWDPLLDWAEATYGARLVPTRGIMPVAQSPDALEALRKPVAALDAFGLMGLHDLVGLSGSLVIGLAATIPGKSPEHLWDVSRIDETWQTEQWGEDDEASAAAHVKRNAFFDAHRFFHAAR